MENSRIKDFYQSSKVFITGGTGFMGKILIEKLLRSTDVSTIYLLVRQKKGNDVHQILDKLLQDKIFDEMKKARPDYRYKIQPVRGDCSVVDLGLSALDRQVLISNTNIIFHLAATVRFDANLKTAYKINVCGTRELIRIAEQMKNLKSFMHVSTAYSNYPVNYIQEKIYEFSSSLEDMCKTIEKLDENDVERKTEGIIEPWPNTYTFTKAMAELTIKQRSSNIPVAIFRPSVVMPTYKEPIPGWTDNLNGPSVICLGVIAGVVKVGPHDNNESLADLVPVDLCVSGLIASAWDITLKRKSRTPENTPVYNFVSGANASPIRWRALLELSAVYGRKYVDQSPNKIFVIFTKIAIYHWILTMIYHTIPAFFIDFFSFFVGKRTRLLATHRKLSKALTFLSPFYTNTWNFEIDNITQLWQSMNDTDRQLFPFALKDVNWNAYFACYIKSLRQRYLMKANHSIPSGASFFWDFLKTSLIFLAFNTVISNYPSL